MNNLKVALISSSLMLASSSINAAEVAGNVTLATDYIYRGISQTGEEATIQGGFDITGDSGLYVGVWASNIAFDGSIEIDIYAGFAGEINENLGFDIGLLHYDYPNNAGPNDSNFDEIYGSLSYRDLTVGVAYSNDFFFETGNATYVYVDYSLPLPNSFGLGFHYASQSIDKGATFGIETTERSADYAEYSIGINRTVADIDLSLTWHDTDLSTNDCFNGTDLCKSRLVFGLSKSL
ncbi:MAG: hypothetical protein CMQ20_04350 [Gammaproteobacteria bacterium]|jgi:uncharacterized protein (TIGR02001 family)|nr:hypothetical protein [Gammaproteobacteria bacterium]|tara:strand:+ start:102 stop:809 length:708 start_codon:yes stop_codon:yes gene_type:complete